MTDETTKSYQDRSVWLRGLYMLIFTFFLGVAKFVTFVVVIFQFLSVLLTRKTNERLIRLGQSLSTYQYQIIMFLTYNSEDHPFPMGEWPDNLKLSAENKP
jgi:hypothetical protein